MRTGQHFAPTAWSIKSESASAANEQQWRFTSGIGNASGHVKIFAVLVAITGVVAGSCGCCSKSWPGPALLHPDPTAKEACSRPDDSCYCCKCDFLQSSQLAWNFWRVPMDILLHFSPKDSDRWLKDWKSFTASSLCRDRSGWILPSSWHHYSKISDPGSCCCHSWSAAWSRGWPRRWLQLTSHSNASRPHPSYRKCSPSSVAAVKVVRVSDAATLAFSHLHLLVAGR